MSGEFNKALQAYREKMSKYLEERLADLPAEERAPLIAFVLEALVNLRLLVYQGPDGWAEMVRLLKEKPKA